MEADKILVCEPNDRCERKVANKTRGVGTKYHTPTQLPCMEPAEMWQTSKTACWLDGSSVALGHGRPFIVVITMRAKPLVQCDLWGPTKDVNYWKKQRTNCVFS